MHRKLTILSVSFHDLRYPLHGSARLILSSLGSLARNGHDVFHLYLSRGSNVSVNRVYVRSSDESDSFQVVEVPGGAISHNQLRYMWVSKLTGLPGVEPDVIICEDRRLALPCRALSRKLRVPWLMRVDRLRSIYCRETYAATRDPRVFLEAVPGVMSYIMLTRISDVGLCVTKKFEVLLRKTLVNNVYTVEPTYMLLDPRSDTPDIRSPEGIDDLPADLALFSGPLQVLLSLASKTPEVSYVMTGRDSFYALQGLEESGTRLPNVFLLGRTKDSDQPRLYRKIRFALIARPKLTGISMKSIEALSFGKPCITDLNTASALMGLSSSKAALVENRYAKWHIPVRRLWSDDDLRREMGKAAPNYFSSHLSPRVHSLRMERCLLNTIGEGNGRRQ